MNTEKLQELRNDLVAGRIDVQTAGGLVYSSSTKPWQTSEWQHRRAEMLKDCCEQCGSTERPLVIQHMWHPKSYRQYVSQIFDQIVGEKCPDFSAVSEKDCQDHIKEYGQERLGCPGCGSVKIRARAKLKPKYICDACKSTFEESVPVIFVYGAPDRRALMNQIRNARESNFRKRLWEEVGDEVRKQAILANIDDYIRYLSFIDAVTFCKRCAFEWDKNHRRLCSRCKKKYHYHGMPLCKDCMQKERIRDDDGGATR